MKLIPFINGDEYDALTHAKRLRHWRTGERRQIRRRYNRRVRHMVVYEEDLVHRCGDCGQELQIVRPGKYQCVNCDDKE